MAFDLSTAKPAASTGGFDLSTAQPADEPQPEPQQPSRSIGDVLAGNKNIAFYQDALSKVPPGGDIERTLKEAMDKEVSKTMELEQVRMDNPALAEMIEEMPNWKKSAVGFGRGLTDIARGAGLAEEEQGTEALDALEGQSPGGGGARMLGQMAPFAPLGIGASAIRSGALRLPGGALRLAAYSGLGASEGFTSARGEGKDPLLRTVIGAAAPVALALGAKAATKGAETLAERSVNRARIVDQLKTSSPSDLVDDIEMLSKSKDPNASKQIAVMLDEAKEAGISHPTIKRLSDEVGLSGDAGQAAKIIKADRTKAIQAEAAKYKVEGGRLRRSAQAKKLMNMGVEESDIQLFAGSSSADKAKLAKIVSRAQAAQKDAMAKIEIHPQEVVGDSLLDRLNAVQKINNTAGIRIDKIADTVLKNKAIDLGVPLTNFKKKLDKMGIKFDDGAIDYSRSSLRGMPDLQKQIDDVIEQLSPQGMPNANAYDAHILKQWFDNQINWGKSAQGQGGIPPKVERAIKGLRADVNTEIGNVSTAYAKANKTYSETIDAINDLKGLAGKNRDLGDDFASETLGMLAKRVTSNAMSRGQVRSAIDKLDKVSAKYGKPFADDIGRQVAAVNALEKKLGSFSDTSLKGQSAAADAVDVTAKAAVDPVGAGVSVLRSFVNKRSKIDNDALLKAFEEIIKKK